MESESDSDQSNHDGGQRSVQTGATAGSDSGMEYTPKFSCHLSGALRLNISEF